jgi:pimeloyl-ACP methyl ester carboxylesterase
VPFVDGTQARTFYERFGVGPDIVFVSGGGSRGSDWHPYQVPHFSRSFRCTTYDCRGVGDTMCDRSLPWPVSSFSLDLEELIEAACAPPVALVGLSLGSSIVQECAIRRPDLVRCAVVMGTGARSPGWTWDYQEAEIEFRRAGGRLDGMMAVAHYAPMLYPARVLGDPELWPRIRAQLLAWYETEDNEASLIPQWEASLRVDQRETLPACEVPIHVIAFTEDVQAPPQDGKEVADLAPNAEYHLFEGMGHASIYGHTHEVLNPFIEDLIRRAL